MTDKPFVLAIVGATASGKTWLGIEIAKNFNGEVVSADSMQIYKGLDIASAKPTKEEMQGIPHHLIDFLERDVSFSAADYVKLANEKIQDILRRGKLPIVVGGTGLYIDSLLENVKFSEVKSDENYRRELYNIAETQGNDVLYRKLLDIDPAAAENIHMNNVVRVVRALEVFHVTGRKFSELKAKSKTQESPYNSLIIGLNCSDRNILYKRINQRVDEMLANGLVDEARNIWIKGDMKTAANAIGYKELIPFFEGISPLNECVDKIKQETRRYAKRQLTWFRRNDRIEWIIFDDFSQKHQIYQKAEKTMVKYRNP
ncbi:MAG: tRNA (adenosine(37)-N6)-dimethylallyltransferase MiaA [Ruminococcus sp.]|nr:tRNA (adenosine(37)-N6)-dimethylallyltransferase MiaA [Ruminococcus sp.]